MTHFLPQTIKICGMIYSVSRDKDSELICGNCNAEIRYNDLEIVLKSTLVPQNAERILLHEVIHGILNELGYSKLRDDEEFVHGFGNVLYQVLKDNKLF